MRLEAEVARRSVIGAARGEVELAAGADPFVSKENQGKLPADLAKATDIARAKKGAGAQVTVDDVVDAYAAHVSRTLREVNTKGPKWLSLAEQSKIGDPGLRQRIGAARAEAMGGGALLTEAKLVQLSAKYVKENSEAELGGDTGKIFPHVEDAEEGLHAYLMSGAQGARTAAFAKEWFGDGAPAELKDFDPQKHQIIAVQRTQDEESLFISVIDRRSGRTAHAGEMGVVDLTYTMDQAAFERIMGPVAQFGVESIDDLDHYDVIEALVKGGTHLEIGNSNEG